MGSVTYTLQPRTLWSWCNYPRTDVNGVVPGKVGHRITLLMGPRVKERENGRFKGDGNLVSLWLGHFICPEETSGGLSSSSQLPGA